MPAFDWGQTLDYLLHVLGVVLAALNFFTLRIGKTVKRGMLQDDHEDSPG